MKDLTTKIFAAGLTAAVFATCFTACNQANIPADTEPRQTKAEESVEKRDGKNNVGGWKTAENNEVTEEQKKFFKEATGKLNGYFYTPVALLATQVVSGTNYVFLCKSTIEGHKASQTMKFTYIYVDLQGNASFKGDKNLVLPGAEDKQMPGGWTAATDTKVTEDVNKIVTNATEKLVGAKLEPIAYLGSQVVAGKNHMILCKSTPVALNGSASYVIITVYQDLQGNCKITETKDIDINFS